MVAQQTLPAYLPLAVPSVHQTILLVFEPPSPTYTRISFSPLLALALTDQDYALPSA
jgi:hypothetical protein